MNDYSVAVSTVVFLAFVGFLNYFFRSKKGRAGYSVPRDRDVDAAVSDSETGDHAGELLDSVTELPPHGQVLMLSASEAGAKPNAVWDKLSSYCDGRMPYVGLIVDFSHLDYEFSSEDLAGVASAIAAWVRGWVAPCAIVMQGSGAQRLKQLLAVTRLDAIDALRIVDSVDLGRAHVERYLTRRAV